jgi:hypothetical protein
MRGTSSGDGTRARPSNVQAPPQDAAGDVEPAVGHLPGVICEVEQLRGLLVHLDRLAARAIDPRDHTVVAVAAEFSLDAPCAGGDRARHRLRWLLMGGFHEHFAGTAHGAELRPPQPRGVQRLK